MVKEHWGVYNIKYSHPIFAGGLLSFDETEKVIAKMQQWIVSEYKKNEEIIQWKDKIKKEQ